MKNHQTELTENEELCDLYRKKAEELVSQMTIEELADQTLNSAPPIERLNIKGYDWWNDKAFRKPPDGNTSTRRNKGLHFRQSPREPSSHIGEQRSYLRSPYREKLRLVPAL